ncbi:hypothetical protein Y032_0095g2842 [Ancylostoma ceylanicum]|uniref:Protein kinase domain-containing protein n=1 Tax=Ancylostoma ceylanicum TaxID=53326 RepID=A0A016TKM2_9BILA|nr:hypothetical protein Y032_0095g2842 [Ancylostoma ceylanicum]
MHILAFRYYRPPELLLGAKIYGCEIDIWSAACVFGEMLRGAVLFPGKNTFNQMELYVECFGLPTDNDALAMSASKSKWKDLKTRYNGKNCVGQHLRKMLPTSKDCPAEAVAILEQMLVYIPTQRLHGPQLLCDPFFKELFDKKTKRPSGKPIACLSSADIKEVLSGDVSMTGSIQSILQ